jgi:hypothetical protein
MPRPRRAFGVSQCQFELALPFTDFLGLGVAPRRSAHVFVAEMDQHADRTLSDPRLLFCGNLHWLVSVVEMPDAPNV